MRSDLGISRREIELDFIRGIAILAVLDFHFAQVSPFWKPFAMAGLQHVGWAGVDLFFVMSGFLVGGLLMKEWKTKKRVDGLRFLKRRAFKIWPAYYFFLLVEVIVRVHPLHTFLLGNLLNVQNYTGTSIPHTWSLAVEEHFYVLLTLLLIWWAGSQRSSKSLFYFLMILSLSDVALRSVLGYNGFAVEKYTHTRIDALMWGVMLAILFHFYPARFIALQERAWTLRFVAFASAAGLFVFPDSGSAIAITLANTGCMAVFLLLYRQSENHSLPYRAVAFIGVYSYGIYLWHLSVKTPLRYVERWVPSIGRPIFFHLGPYVCAILLGIAMTKLIEFPLLRLRERLIPAEAPPWNAPVPGQPQPPVALPEHVPEFGATAGEDLRV